jgi:hemin uptake protein HemP
MKVIAGVVSSEHLNMDGPSASVQESSAKVATNGKLSSAKLFGNSNEVIIQHQEETYVLRLTKQNKLILTK